jgi:hypothetical protein
MTWQSCVAATTSRRTGQAAIVIDDQASTDPWRPGGRGSGPNRGDLSVSAHSHSPTPTITWGLSS